MSQFNYGGALDEGNGELPATSQPIPTQQTSVSTAKYSNYNNYNYAPPSDLSQNTAQYMTGAYG